MIVERPSAARGEVSAGWLDSRHTFSFGHYHDPDWMGFGVLRVINEDRVAPRSGFPAHRHANMEILSYVLEGVLAHRDSLGTGGGPGGDGRADAGVIRAGQLQWMSAGHGIEHSEFNASDDEPVHFLQIWLQPDRVNAEPAYALREAVAGDGWQWLASPDGRDGSLAIRQQASLRLARLPAEGGALEFTLEPTRRYWLHVARGDVQLDGRALQAGDALGFAEESGAHRLQADAAAEVLLFDLPL